MDVKRLAEPRIDGLTLISSLPDMGRVGGLVSDHISKKLGAQPVARITVADKPWINQRLGLVEVPRDEYALLADEGNRIVIFTGGNQPREPDTVMRLTDLVLSEARRIGTVSRVISAGGYLPARQGDGDGDRKEAGVFGVATDRKTLDLLKDNGIGPLTSEVNSITWFNGLILGRAKDAGIGAAGLFGEIADSDTPQYGAAGNVVRAIGRILGIDIGTGELDEKTAEPPARTRTEPENPGIG